MGVVGAAVLGHMYSPFAGFKGGKGVATGLGAMLGVYPLITFPAVGCFAIWLALAAVFRYVSLASCVVAVALPAQVWFFAHQRGCAGEAWMAPFYVVTALVALLVIARHRANIRRLLGGTEHRIGAFPKR
jgi:glycerol-3-phosphate acyltransferase PlsY